VQVKFKQLKTKEWIAYIGLMGRTFMPIYCEVGDINIIYQSIKVKLDELLQR